MQIFFLYTTVDYQCTFIKYLRIEKNGTFNFKEIAPCIFCLIAYKVLSQG